VHPLTIDRSAASPFGVLALFVQLLLLFWKLRPSVVHLITIKPVLLGGLATRLSPVKGVVFAISGLGHVFVAGGVKAALRRKLVQWLYRAALAVRNKRVIFQNPVDEIELKSILSLSSHQVVRIPGSGVDLAAYPVQAEQSGVPVVLMAARLLKTKGVMEFAAAANLLRARCIAVRFQLAGDLDPHNPSSLMVQELQALRGEGLIEILGHQTDVSNLMAKANLVVLPSYYREGLPKVLIEAAACGRAVITTDVPGCRDAIEPNVTGLLVPARDAVALADAIERLVTDPSMRMAMGKAGRQRAEQLFDIRSVISKHLEIYAELAGRGSMK
jgi:glycosyltransferase involved in cell wall biosynthesis